jgi:SAM-dependent methyltransferase
LASAFDHSHYNREEVWRGSNDDSVELERAERTAALVPRASRSVLDVGAGAGVVTSVLRRGGRWVAAIDLSSTALEWAGDPRILGDGARLPVRDRGVDAVVSTEMLEHLPGQTLDAVLAEIGRVARHSVVLSVPNREVLASMMVRCADCTCQFHPWRHARSFSPASVESLLLEQGFELQALEEFGPRSSYPPDALARVAHLFGGWYRPTGRSAVCPACGNQDRFTRRDNLGTLLFRSAPGRITRQRPYWLLACYARRSR